MTARNAPMPVVRFADETTVAALGTRYLARMGETARRAQSRGASRGNRRRHDARRHCQKCTATAAPKTMLGEAMDRLARRCFVVSKVYPHQRRCAQRDRGV
jgi:hypothetical protein